MKGGRSRTKHTVTLRESRGRDIDAACGQLYRKARETADGR